MSEKMETVPTPAAKIYPDSPLGSTEAGIPTAVHYPVPLNEQPAYKHLCCPDCTPVAQQLAKKVMSLPMGADLDVNTQHSIIERLFRN
jgi:dTDP-4-amino-4,6-dideoxygalactose transaminase